MPSNKAAVESLPRDSFAAKTKYPTIMLAIIAAKTPIHNLYK